MLKRDSCVLSRIMLIIIQKNIYNRHNPLTSSTSCKKNYGHVLKKVIRARVSAMGNPSNKNKINEFTKDFVLGLGKGYR